MNVYLKKQNFLWQKIAAGVVALVLFIVVLNIFQSQIKNTVYEITSPISKSFWGAGDSLSGFFSPFLNVKGLAQENSNLKQENQNLLAQIAQMQQTIQGDQAIKEVIQNTQNNNFTMALAQTIGLDTTNDVMLINEGSDDGIALNMPVISSTKVLLGKVFKVYRNFSQVMLVSNKNSVVDIKILNQDPTKPPVAGAVKGSGNLSMYLDLVPSDATLNQQDTLLTSGQEGIFPQNLLIGKIISINKNDLEPFQTAKIQPLFDLKNSNDVFVITDCKH